MKKNMSIVASLMSVLMVLSMFVMPFTAYAEDEAADTDIPVVTTWSKVEGLWNNYEWLQRVSTNWQTVDGDTVDLSAGGANTANSNYYLSATITINPIAEGLTEDNVVEQTFKYLWYRLRTSGTEESRECMVNPSDVLNIEKNVITLLSPLSGVATGEMDWSNVTQLNFAYHFKDVYHSQDAAAASMTVSDVKIVDLTGITEENPDDPNDTPDDGQYLLFSNNDVSQTSAEGHVLSGIGATSAVDLSAYAGGKVDLKFGIKINKTENFQHLDRAIVNMAEKDWIKYINAGRFSLSIQDAEGNKKNVDLANSEYGGYLLNGGVGDLAELNTEDFVYVTIPLPRSVIDAGGMIVGFHVYIYNNFHNITSEGSDSWNASHGVTATYTKVELLADMSDVPTWEKLQTLIDETKKTDEELNRYTEESVKAFQALIAEAQVVADFKEEASVTDIVQYINLLKEANMLLVEALPDGGVVPLFPAEQTSGEAHYMSVAQSFVTPFDLTRFGMRDSWNITLELKVNKLPTFPEALKDTPDNEWIKKIVNGSLVLYAGDLRVNMADVDALYKVSSGVGQLEEIISDSYIEVSFPVPDEIVKAGLLTKVEFFMYNDLHALVEGSSADDVGSQGVTISVRNVNLVIGKEVIVDKSALADAITAAETALADDTKNYTDDTKAAVEAALNAAKTVNENAAATQDAVDAAVTALNNAVAGLMEKEPEPEVVYGDLDGNNTVEAADALLALQIATGKVSVTEAQQKAGDVDNGEAVGITANDALLILQYATKKIEVFPVENK